MNPPRKFRGKELIWVQLEFGLQSWVSLQLAQKNGLSVALLVSIPGAGVYWASSADMAWERPAWRTYNNWRACALFSPEQLYSYLIAWVNNPQVMRYSFSMIFYRSGRLKLVYHVYGVTPKFRVWLAWRKAPPKIRQRTSNSISTDKRETA